MPRHAGVFDGPPLGDDHRLALGHSVVVEVLEEVSKVLPNVRGTQEPVVAVGPEQVHVAVSRVPLVRPVVLVGVGEQGQHPAHVGHAVGLEPVVDVPPGRHELLGRARALLHLGLVVEDEEQGCAERLDVGGPSIDDAVVLASGDVPPVHVGDPVGRGLPAHDERGAAVANPLVLRVREDVVPQVIHPADPDLPSDEVLEGDHGVLPVLVAGLDVVRRGPEPGPGRRELHAPGAFGSRAAGVRRLP